MGEEFQNHRGNGRQTSFAVIAVPQAATLPPDTELGGDCLLYTSFIPASSLVRTAKIPMMESKIPTAAISIGAMTALNCITVSSLSLIHISKGASDAGVFPAIAVIGDSTFTHSGMTGLLDAVNDLSLIHIWFE